jgi:protein N-lysine methyltransferase METTL21A
MNSDSEQDPFGVFGVSEDLVQSPTHKQASTTKVDFDGLLQDHPLRLHEDLANGNGGQAWPAGRVLAKYMLRRKRDALRDCTMCVASSLVN